MSIKAPRVIIATLTVALMSVGGLAAPVEAAAQIKQTARTGWCC